LPLRNYEAHVDLEPHGRGTVVRWRSSFDAGIPGTGWLYHRVLRGFLATTARAVAVAAAHAPA
jgi:hypothetical protein